MANIVFYGKNEIKHNSFCYFQGYKRTIESFRLLTDKFFGIKTVFWYKRGPPNSKIGMIFPDFCHFLHLILSKTQKSSHKGL